MRRGRAITLLEMLVVAAVVTIGGVAVAKVVGHSLRLGERAQLRAEMVAMAQTEIDRLRLTVSEHPSEPRLVRLRGNENLRTTIDHRRHEEHGLLGLTVTIETLRSPNPLRVSLTGWIPLDEAVP